MKWSRGIPLLLLALTTQVQSESTEKSDSLGLSLSVPSACPFTESTLLERVEGEYYRSRLTPDYEQNNGFHIGVRCVKLSNTNGRHTGYAVSYEIQLGIHDPSNDMTLILSEPNFGSMLAGGKGEDARQFFLNAIRDDVSSAITFYYKNFK